MEISVRDRDAKWSVFIGTDEQLEALHDFFIEVTTDRRVIVQYHPDTEDWRVSTAIEKIEGSWMAGELIGKVIRTPDDFRFFASYSPKFDPELKADGSLDGYRDIATGGGSSFRAVCEDLAELYHPRPV